MADNSELDYIRTFLGECHASATAKQFSEIKKISLINDTERILVYPGEVINTNTKFYTKRFPVKLSETTEANLTGMLNDIINGCEKYNVRDGTLTEVSTMCNIHVAYGNKSYENPQTKRWDCDIYLDIEWSTS